MGREARWRQCISGTDRVLGLALGAMFVRNAFSGESKERVERMVAEVRASFMDSFPHRSWMDERTSWLATEKAKAIVDLIGYPAYILNNTRMEKDYEEVGSAVPSPLHSHRHSTLFLSLSLLRGSVFLLQRSVFLLQRSVFLLQRSVFQLQRSVFLLKRSVFLLQRSVCLLQRSVCLLQGSVCLSITLYVCGRF